MTETEIQTQRLHGRRLAYRRAGDPQAPAILLVHGITNSSASWAPVVGRLAHAHDVIAPDLPGHGDSDRQRGDHSLGAHASMLRDLLAALGRDKVTVVGHSLGGGVAMQFAYQFPEHVERLVLVGSGGLGREVSPAIRSAALPFAEQVLPFLISKPLIGAGGAINGLLGRIGVQPAAELAELARGVASLGDTDRRAAFVRTVRSVVSVGGQRVSATDRLYLAQDVPMLIVWGARDPIIPVAHAHAAHEAVPSSRLEIFERSRHWPHLDDPQRFCQVMTDFIATTEPAAWTFERGRERLLAGA